MNEGLLFAIGFVVFIVVTTAILMFGYMRFNELYRRDRAKARGPRVRTEGYSEFYASGDPAA